MSTSNYRKVEERVVADYGKAQEVADHMFAPYSSADERGSRTCPDAKVRIRLRKGDFGGFRVILYKHISSFETKKKEDAPTKSKSKKARHRNDRKGKKKSRAVATD